MGRRPGSLAADRSAVIRGVHQAHLVGAKVLWLQEGILNEEALRIAMEGGLDVVMGACMMREHERVEG